MARTPPRPGPLGRLVQRVVTPLRYRARYLLPGALQDVRPKRASLRAALADVGLLMRDHPATAPGQLILAERVGGGATLLRRYEPYVAFYEQSGQAVHRWGLTGSWNLVG